MIAPSRPIFHAQVGGQLFQSGVLGFELSLSVHVGRLHAAKLGHPLVESGRANVVLAENTREWAACFGFPEHPYDLAFGKRDFRNALSGNASP